MPFLNGAGAGIVLGSITGAQSGTFAMPAGINALRIATPASVTSLTVTGSQSGTVYWDQAPSSGNVTAIALTAGDIAVEVTVIGAGSGDVTVVSSSPQTTVVAGGGTPLADYAPLIRQVQAIGEAEAVASFTAQFVDVTTAGNSLLQIVACCPQTTITGITDSAGNTWEPVLAVGTGNSLAVFQTKGLTKALNAGTIDVACLGKQDGAYGYGTTVVAHLFEIQKAPLVAASPVNGAADFAAETAFSVKNGTPYGASSTYAQPFMSPNDLVFGAVGAATGLAGAFETFEASGIAFDVGSQSGAFEPSPTTLTEAKLQIGTDPDWYTGGLLTAWYLAPGNTSQRTFAGTVKGASGTTPELGALLWSVRAL